MGLLDKSREGLCLGVRLSGQVCQLRSSDSNFKRHLADGDQRLPDAKQRMLLIMREKLNEHIQREDRKTVQRQEVAKAQCTLLLARTESDEVYKKLATLGNTMANNLQLFIMREHGWRKPARLYCGADGCVQSATSHTVRGPRLLTTYRTDPGHAKP